MRRINPFHFGFFVGLSVFVLKTLVTNGAWRRPVLGATLAMILTTVALCLIVHRGEKRRSNARFETCLRGPRGLLRPSPQTAV